MGSDVTINEYWERTVVWLLGQPRTSSMQQYMEKLHCCLEGLKNDEKIGKQKFPQNLLEI